MAAAMLGAGVAGGDDLFEHKVHLESAVQLKAGDTLQGFKTQQFLAATKSGSVIKWEEVLVKPELVKSCKDYGWAAPKRVQAGVLPLVLHPSKPGMLVQAFTGSGKTGCFTLAALSHVDPTVPRTQAVILSPTRLLTEQTYGVLASLVGDSGITTAMYHGEMDKEAAKAPCNAHVIVSTVGKLKNAVTKRGAGRAPVDVSGVTMLVLDEADDMMSGSNFPDVGAIRKLMAPTAQVMLFGASFATLEDPANAATYDANKKQLFGATSALKVSLGNPAWNALVVEVDFAPGSGKAATRKRSEPASRVERLGMFYWPPPATLATAPLDLPKKVAYIKAVLARVPDKRALVFVEAFSEANTVAAALSAKDDAAVLGQLQSTFARPDKKAGGGEVAANLAAQTALAGELDVAVIHRGVETSVAKLLMTRLRTNKVKVVVATNSMSTGIDLPDVDLVFNLTFPMKTEGGGGGGGRRGGRGRTAAPAGSKVAMPEIKKFQNRVGRTARNGKFGACVCLLGAPEDVPVFSGLATYLHFSPTELPYTDKAGAAMSVADAAKKGGKVLAKYVGGLLEFPLLDEAGNSLGSRVGAQPRPPKDEAWIQAQGATRPAAAASAEEDGPPGVGAGVPAETVG